MAVSADMNKDEDESDGCHDETNDHQGSMYLSPVIHCQQLPSTNYKSSLHPSLTDVQIITAVHWITEKPISFLTSQQCYSTTHYIPHYYMYYYYFYWLTEHGFTSAPTQYRLYGRQFLQVWWPNQQWSTEGGWLVIQTGLNLTMLTSPCYNTTTCMQILHKKII